MRRTALLLAALAAAALTACGGPDSLSENDGVELDLARDRIVAAVAVEQRLSRSPATADRLLARVRRIVAAGALEAKQLDEFGLAALGELQLAVPGLVVVDRQEIPRRLDRKALSAFLANAGTDAAAAMRRPAAAATGRIVDVLTTADAGPGTEIPVAEMTVDVYLADVAARLQPAWPGLAADLSALRSRL